MIASCIAWTCSASLRSSCERASPTSRQESGTTFAAVPPSITPMFAVVSSSIRPSFISEIARAAAAIAERPSSGNMPGVRGAAVEGDLDQLRATARRG